MYVMTDGRKIRLTKAAAREVARSMNPIDGKFKTAWEYRTYCRRRRQRIAWHAVSLLGFSAADAKATVRGIVAQCDSLSIDELIETALDCLTDPD